MTFMRAFSAILAAMIISALWPAAIAHAQTPQTELSAAEMFEMAKAFHDGTGQTQDFEKAKALYRKAAARGSNDARLNLGYMAFTGQGRPQSYADARAWYAVAAVNGSEDAKLNLAMMDKNGLGLPPKAEPETVKTKPAKPDAQIPAISKARGVNIPKAQNMPLQVENHAAPLKIIEPLDAPPMAGPAPDNPVMTAPRWTFAALIAGLFTLAAGTGLWFILQYRKLSRQRVYRAFAMEFFEHHRETLRTSFLKYPLGKRYFWHFDDVWATLLCVLMVKHAIRLTHTPGPPDEKTNANVQAFCARVAEVSKSKPAASRRLVFPLIPAVQAAIVSDIRAAASSATPKSSPFHFRQPIPVGTNLKLVHSDSGPIGTQSSKPSHAAE